MDRGPDIDRVDSECDRCGGYYMDCGLPQAQSLHDRDLTTRDCGGRLRVVPEVQATAPVQPIVRPRRFQRRRTKGWRKPANTRCVTRPGKFGNPFPSAAQFRTWLERLTDGHPLPALDSPEARHMKRIADSLIELRGFNLACYCDLESECHADVLLDFSNR